MSVLYEKIKEQKVIDSGKLLPGQTGLIVGCESTDSDFLNTPVLCNGQRVVNLLNGATLSLKYKVRLCDFELREV